MTPLRDTRQGEISQFMSRLAAAGLTREGVQVVGSSPDLSGLLVAHIEAHEPGDPWSLPVALYASPRWRSIDGAEPGNVQMRDADGVLQVRTRSSCEVVEAARLCKVDHPSEDCLNCWRLREITPSELWRQVTGRIRVRVTDVLDSGTGDRRVEVIRRLDAKTQVLPEAEWSEPWTVPDYSKVAAGHGRDDRYVNITDDVQVYTGHTYPTGALVRQATRPGDDPQWTTPMFVPNTHHQWVSVVPDGSLEIRTWVKSSSRVEARQRVGRPHSYAVEPMWGESESPHGRKSDVFHGYKIEMRYREPYYGGYYRRDPIGVRVTDPTGVHRDYLVTDRYIMVAPNLKVNASFQGWFTVYYGTFEPVTPRPTWSRPDYHTLEPDTWTQIDGQVRARPALPGAHGIHVQSKIGSSAWYNLGVWPNGTVNEITPNLRVTVTPWGDVEVQHALSPAQAE
jgi:hypothetical protein